MSMDGFHYIILKKEGSDDMFNVSDIRSDFPLLKEKIHGKPLIYLDNAATTQKPSSVINRINDFYTHDNSNIHRGIHTLSQRATQAYDDARKVVKNFIHANSEREIIFTSGTTESINLVAYSYGEAFVNEGDEIIITEMEHHSNIVPWQMLCDRKKAILKVVPFDDEGLCLETYRSLFSEKTKLVAVTYVSNVLGTVNPVKDMIRIAHIYDVPVLVDGAQAIQHKPIDVTDMDCDFFVFSGHKIYAETGIGILYGKEKWLEQMPPYQVGGGMIDSVCFEKTTFTDLPFKFESGTQNYVGAISLHYAIEYLETIGMSQVENAETGLYTYALRTLSAFPWINVYGNSLKRCGSISFNMERVHHYDAGSILDKLGIAVRTGNHCAQPVMKHYDVTGTIRASFAIYNLHEEIDQLASGLEKVHTMML